MAKHPTQKPVELFAYLLKTYTQKGDLVLDNCAGSCTTAIAALQTERNWICIEKEEKYCKIGEERIKNFH
jgi:site-specific DNA-methyltransferase (adenine-specific)